jgi:hypothetical protein
LLQIDRIASKVILLVGIVGQTLQQDIRKVKVGAIIAGRKPARNSASTSIATYQPDERHNIESAALVPSMDMLPE